MTFETINKALSYVINLDRSILCDAPEAWQIGMQDPATPQAEGMIFFHHYLLLFIVIIGIAVCYVLMVILQKFSIENNLEKSSVKFSHDSLLEIIWTVAPAISLIFIAVPSFNLLYSLDELVNPSLTVKIIGHQWYWSYEYSDFCAFNKGTLYFDSYMINTDDLVNGEFRLLEVDARLLLPIKTHIRLLVTASDVLHSWAIPSFGIKVDACPGRLSQASLFIKRIGSYYGQCSEICGINHGFMPIVVQGVPKKAFIVWVLANIGVDFTIVK